MKLNNVTKLAPALALVATGAANAAAADVVSVITSSMTDGVAVAAALVLIGVTVWGAMYLKTRFFK